MAEPRLPIKIVQTRNEDFQRPEAGGGPRKIFDEETLPEQRQRLRGDIARVEAAFASVFQLTPNVPAVARVQLKEEAIAKSHRPSALLTAATPVIGVERFGELLVSVKPSGLRTLSDRINSDDTKVRRADISTIRSIEPYTQANVLHDDIESLAAAVTREGVLKLRLFDHRNSALNAIVYKAFLEHVKSLGLPVPEELPYGGDLRIFRVRDVTDNAVEPLARFVGTQSLSLFPKYQSIETASIAHRTLTAADCPPPVDGVIYPVVGVIDSGTNPADPFLAPWIVAREEYVPPADRDYGHGSFVAGLIAQPRPLNQGDSRFPGTSSKIIDVVAIPKGGISEDELLTILEEVLPKHPDVRVWNLSLGGFEPAVMIAHFRTLRSNSTSCKTATTSRLFSLQGTTRILRSEGGHRTTTVTRTGSAVRPTHSVESPSDQLRTCIAHPIEWPPISRRRSAGAVQVRYTSRSPRSCTWAATATIPAITSRPA